MQHSKLYYVVKCQKYKNINITEPVYYDKIRSYFVVTEMVI